mmetsp:Transcript_8853/g.24529  ORF Transcript_8853/g.24529 Transcript_8853/m.24529 type:complete len:453 (-) Transcript_8853:19-1377(-)
MTEIEINFRLDHNGRTILDTISNQVAEGSDDASSFINYSAQTTQTTLRSVDSNNNDNGSLTEELCASWMDELFLDCEVADSALMPRTFWVPASGFSPRCSMEQMALDVFHYHTRNLPKNKFELKSSGAEWWVQLRPSPKGGRYSVLDKDPKDQTKRKDSSSGLSEDDLSKDGISFHWDKDEDLRLLMGGSTYIHPHISTVTYLTDRGAPTMAINCRIHPLQGEWMHPSQCDQVDAEAFLSWPLKLKHLSFDGRYLHAAPPVLSIQEKKETPSSDDTQAPTDPREGRKAERRKRRATFLVNVWLNYHPINVDVFPVTMLDKMSGHSAAISETTTSNGASQVGLSFTVHERDIVDTISVETRPNSKQQQQEQSTDANEKSNPKHSSQTFVWPMGDCGSGEIIAIRLPSTSEMQTKADAGGNVRVQWTDSGAGVKLGKSMPLLSSQSEPKKSRTT